MRKEGKLCHIPKCILQKKKRKIERNKAGRILSLLLNENHCGKSFSNVELWLVEPHRLDKKEEALDKGQGGKKVVFFFQSKKKKKKEE